MKVKTRNAIGVLAGVLVVVLAVAGCGDGGSTDKTSGADGTASGEPFKVALLPTLSGAYAAYGEGLEAGARFAAERANAEGGVDGREVEIVVNETDGNPPTTLRAARKAVTEEGADFLTATVSSSEAAAIQGQLQSLGALYFNSLSRDDILTGEECAPNAFAVAPNNSMVGAAAIGEAVKSGIKDWLVLAADYSYGRDAAAVFTKRIEEEGGTVKKTLFAPLGTTDFGSYIPQQSDSIPAGSKTGLFALISGGDSIVFVNQAAQFDFFDEIAQVQGSLFLPTLLWEGVGKKAIGIRDVVDYYPALETPENEEFVEAWKEANGGEAPSFVEADSYIAMQVLFEGIRKAGSVDPEEVREALSGTPVNTLVGEVTMRSEDHLLLRPTYAVEMVAGDISAGMGLKVLGTYPASETSPEPNPACSL